MPDISFLIPILLYLFVFILGIAVTIYLISFLRTATRYLELKIQEMKYKYDQ